MNPTELLQEPLEDSTLFKLMEICQDDHDLIFFGANDGAFIIECLDCPFHYILDSREEEYLQKQMDSKSVTL